MINFADSRTLVRIVGDVGFAAIVISAFACGSGTSVAPTTSCSGGSLGIGFGGPVVSGFTLDRSTLTDGQGMTLHVGERARVRVTVGRPSVSNSCRSYPAFTYMKWSWNWATAASQSTRTIPQNGPVDVAVALCNCRLFGEPYWDEGATGGTPHWVQRAWLDGEQRLEFEIRAVSPGSTSLFVIGFAGPPYPTTNPVIDNATYEDHQFRASVIP